MSTSFPDIMTTTQAAEYLQVDRVTIYRYIRQGRLIASSLGHAYRIPRQNLDLLLVASAARPEIVLREYTPEERARFLTDDALEPEALRFTRHIDDILERR